MMLEIGGGTLPLGGDWVNIDQCETADIRHDLNEVPWPIQDEEVAAIYSSHCIEHVKDPHSFLRECVRVGKVGTVVEIRCPAPHSHLAMTAGHLHVFSLQGVRNELIHFPNWTPSWGSRKLVLKSHRYQPSEMLDWAKKDLPFLRGVDDQAIMRWIPGTVHDSVFIFEVE